MMFAMQALKTGAAKEETLLLGNSQAKTSDFGVHLTS
jgi:hypothetical protein